MLSNLLIMRLAILQAVVISAVIYGVSTGYVQELVWSDKTGLPFLMIGIATLAVISGHIRAFKVSKGLNIVKAGGSFDTSKLSIKNGHLMFLAVCVMVLSLIGNSEGFRDGLDGAQEIINSDPDWALKILGKMAEGIVAAMSNVIIGLWLYLWVLSTSQILHTATRLLEVDANK